MTMPFAETLAEALAGLGPMVEEIESIVQTDAASWIVRFGDADLEIEGDPEGGTIGLSALVGFPIGSDAARIHRTLLQYNLLARDTGGVVMALNADDAVVQTATLRAPEVDAAFLATVAANFLAKLRIWRHVIAAPGGSAENLAFDPSLLIRA